MENYEKTYIFTQKWLDHLLLMTLYLEIIVTDRTKLVSKQKKRLVLLFSYGGGGGRLHNSPLYVRGLTES